MALKHHIVAFWTLAAAFVISALYQLYRSALMEVPEYDAFTLTNWHRLRRLYRCVGAGIDRQALGMVDRLGLGGPLAVARRLLVLPGGRAGPDRSRGYGPGRVAG